MEKVNKNICPVCGKETEDLLTHLETEMKEQYDQAIEKLTQELESMKADFRKQNSLLNEYSSLIKVLNESKEKLSEFYKTLSEALKREITEKDEELKELLDIEANSRNNCFELSYEKPPYRDWETNSWWIL